MVDACGQRAAARTTRSCVWRVLVWQCVVCERLGGRRRGMAYVCSPRASCSLSGRLVETVIVVSCAAVACAAALRAAACAAV